MEYAGAFQGLEMFGDGCRRESEGPRQLRDRAIRSSDLKQDSPAGSISQRRLSAPMSEAALTVSRCVHRFNLHIVADIGAI
jgi:hypothetical protein